MLVEFTRFVFAFVYEKNGVTIKEGYSDYFGKYVSIKMSEFNSRLLIRNEVDNLGIITSPVKLIVEEGEYLIVETENSIYKFLKI